MELFHAIMLAIIEGITEFLPVSSTGHMIIYSSLAGIASNEFTKLYTVDIQFGCILSVLVLYHRRFMTGPQMGDSRTGTFTVPSYLKSVPARWQPMADFYSKILIAFLPAAVIGFLLNDFIDSLLENVVVVAISLLLGGIVLVFIDRITNRNDGTGDPKGWGCKCTGCAQNRILPVHRHGSGCIPVGGNNHWRHVSGIVPQAGG